MTEQDFVALWEEDPRKADALVWLKLSGFWGHWPVPILTTTWGGMGLVVEKMREEGKALSITVFSGHVEVGNRTDEGIPLEGWDWDDGDIWATADTAPLAVAIAALKAKGAIE